MADDGQQQHATGLVGDVDNGTRRPRGLTDDDVRDIVRETLREALSAMGINGGRGDEKRRRMPKPTAPGKFDPSEKDSNVRTWLFAMDNYFDALGMTPDDEEECIKTAVTLLAGPALEWWRHVCENDRGGSAVEPADNAPRRRLFPMTPAGRVAFEKTEAYARRPTTWAEFKEALRARFDLVNASTVARNKLKRLRQVAGVQDYTRRFLALCSEVDNISEDEKLDRYFEK